MFNLFIIAVLDVMGGDEPILAQGESGQTLTAALRVLLLGIVVLAMGAGTAIPVVGWSGLVSPAIVALYLGAMYLVSRNEKRSQRERDEVKASQYEDVSKARAFTIYGINAALVIVAATWLPRLGDRIAEMTGLGESSAPGCRTCWAVFRSSS